MVSSQKVDSTTPNPNLLPTIPTSSLELNDFQQSSPGAEPSSGIAKEGSTGISVVLPAAVQHASPEQSSAPVNTETVEEESAAPIPDMLSSAAPRPIQSVRKLSEALGPATDAPIVPPATGVTALTITLQLTTGARHPYKIDEKYLTSRKVETKNAKGQFDPLELSGYKLKELIWTDWRGEWEPRPASPGSIRLIYLGKLLEDSKSLNEYTLALDSPNIIHMTVKPADFDDDEAAGKGGKGSSIRHRDGEERTAGCRCVIL